YEKDEETGMVRKVYDDPHLHVGDAPKKGILSPTSIETTGQTSRKSTPVSFEPIQKAPKYFMEGKDLPYIENGSYGPTKLETTNFNSKDSQGITAWYYGQAPHGLDRPPEETPTPPKQGTIYIHRNITDGGYQIWIWLAQSEREIWFPVDLNGALVHHPEIPARVLTLQASTGNPSWVLHNITLLFKLTFKNRAARSGTPWTRNILFAVVEKAYLFLSFPKIKPEHFSRVTSICRLLQSQILIALRCRTAEELYIRAVKLIRLNPPSRVLLIVKLLEMIPKPEITVAASRRTICLPIMEKGSRGARGITVTRITRRRIALSDSVSIGTVTTLFLLIKVTKNVRLVAGPIVSTAKVLLLCAGDVVLLSFLLGAATKLVLHVLYFIENGAVKDLLWHQKGLRMKWMLKEIALVEVETHWSALQLTQAVCHPAQYTDCQCLNTRLADMTEVNIDRNTVCSTVDSVANGVNDVENDADIPVATEMHETESNHDSDNNEEIPHQVSENHNLNARVKTTLMLVEQDNQQRADSINEPLNDVDNSIKYFVDANSSVDQSEKNEKTYVKQEGERLHRELKELKSQMSAWIRRDIAEHAHLNVLNRLLIQTRSEYLQNKLSRSAMSETFDNLSSQLRELADRRLENIPVGLGSILDLIKTSEIVNDNSPSKKQSHS
ncbi:hypothetical protein GG344DRAFT_71073, partial [Lentinula edodes]